MRTFITDKAEGTKWILQNNDVLQAENPTRQLRISQNSDGSFNVKGSLWLTAPLKVKFKEVHGDFTISSGFGDLQGMPEFITDNLHVNTTGKLTELPKQIFGSLYVSDEQFKKKLSFSGVHKLGLNLENFIVSYEWDRPGLLSVVKAGWMMGGGHRSVDIHIIVTLQPFIRTRDVIGAQEALIEAGFEEYATL